jgi:hypothetical protein
MNPLPGEEPPQRLTLKWITASLFNLTAHLMAAIDRAADQLERLADAAEDIAAHSEYAQRRRTIPPGRNATRLGPDKSRGSS